MNTERKIFLKDTLIFLINKLVVLHGNADKKINIILAMYGLFLLNIYNFVKLNINFFNMDWHQQPLILYFIIIANFIIFIMLIISFKNLYLSLFPRTGTIKKNICHFVTVSEMSTEKLLKEFNSITEEKLIESLIYEYKANSEIAYKKFLYIKKAMIPTIIFFGIYVLENILLYFILQRFK
ncbi:Pycsar system effector family protein [Caminibacter pacificus]